MPRKRQLSAPRKRAKRKTCPKCGKSVTVCFGEACATSRGQSALGNALIAGGTVIGAVVVTKWIGRLLSRPSI